MRQRMLQFAILAALHSILLRFNGVAALAAEGNALSQANNTYSYGEFDGYKDWGGICQKGEQIPQSPINIPSTKIKEALANPTHELDFNYANLTGATAANTGHGVQVNMPEGNFLTVGSTKWKLLQYHFHSPSENSFGGRFASMDIHLVHSNAAGEMAVVAIPLNAQELMATHRPYNLALAQGLEMVPDTIVGKSEPFALDATTFSSLLIPTGALPLGATSGSGSAPAVSFTGSLTTPPCTAGVQWYILIMSSPVGPGQVLSFQRFLVRSLDSLRPASGNGTTLSQNRRPTQPRLNRDISVSMVPSVSLSPDTAPESAPSKVPDPVAAPVAAPVEAPVLSISQQTGLGGKGGLGGLGGRGGGGQGGQGGLGGQGGSGAVNGADGANGANGADGQSFG